MAEYNNNLSGALFVNDKKQNEKQPDYKGNYTDDQGNEFWASAWVKTSKDGKTYISLSMMAKEQQTNQSSYPVNLAKAVPVQGEENESNELPF